MWSCFNKTIKHKNFNPLHVLTCFSNFLYQIPQNTMQVSLPHPTGSLSSVSHIVFKYFSNFLLSLVCTQKHGKFTPPSYYLTLLSESVIWILHVILKSCVLLFWILCTLKQKLFQQEDSKWDLMIFLCLADNCLGKSHYQMLDWGPGQNANLTGNFT